MDSWMQDVVSMMTDGSISRVKQEIETTSCCSPTPSNGNQIQSIVYNSKMSQASPGSPDRQFCSSTTTTLGDAIGDSGSQNSMKEEIPRRLCLVCGDIASGFHYGVASCEACKAFFKRTIQGNIEYTCPANNECEINKRRRKACQACRFQKCLLMGMLKEGVRLDRVRGGRQKYRRNPISNPYQMQVLYPSTTTSPTSLDDIKMLEVLASYDAEHLTVGQYSFSVDGKEEKRLPFDDKERYVDDENEMLDLISDLYDRDLVCIIGWAKQIPGFMDLPINDQMKMLQVSWSEVHTLQLAYRSMPFTGKLAFAKDFSLDERCAKEIGLGEFYNHCVHIIQRLERLSWRKEEYYLLKALVLANCDIRLEEQMMLKKFRDSILSALNDCVYITRHNLAVSHQQQLLLILPALRQADPIIRKFWGNIHREGKTKMNRLLVEMLEPVSR